MRIPVKIFMALTLIFFLSCEDQGIFVKCPDCTETEPVNTYLDVKLDPSSFGYTTQLNVYEGNLEDSVLYDSFKTNSKSTTILVTLNKKFTVTATYYIPDNYYIAVDSATPRVKYEKNQCDNPCYFVYDKTIDLRLKYSNKPKTVFDSPY